MKTLMKILNAKISVSSWVLLASSLFLSIIMLDLALFDPATQHGLFAEQILVPFPIFSGLLVLFNILLAAGMILWRRRMVQWSAMVSFMLWIFGSIALVQSHATVLLVAFAVPYLIFYAYIYLAAEFRVFHDGPLDSPHAL